MCSDQSGTAEASYAQGQLVHTTVVFVSFLLVYNSIYILRTSKLLQPFEKPTSSQTQARLEHLYIYVYTRQFICILPQSFTIDLVSCIMRKISEYSNDSKKFDCSIHP